MRMQLKWIRGSWPTYTAPRRAIQTKLAAPNISDYKLKDVVASSKRLRAPSTFVSHCGSPRLPLSSARVLTTVCGLSRRPVCTFADSVRLLTAGKFPRTIMSSAASPMTQSSSPVTQWSRDWQVRAFSSGSGSDEFPSSSSSASSEDGGEDEGSGGEDGPPVPDVTVGGDLPPSMVALSPMTVPEVWPRVPVIAVRRHPLFPRFIKMIEVLMHCVWYCAVMESRTQVSRPRPRPRTSKLSSRILKDEYLSSRTPTLELNVLVKCRILYTFTQ